MIKPGNKFKYFIVKTNTSRFGWKRWHNNGWKFYSRYATWEAAQEKLKSIKYGSIVIDSEKLKDLQGNWNYNG